MIPGYSDKSYEEGLRILRLNTLEERRNRADLIFLFKMYKGLSHPKFKSLFQLSNHDRTRVHTLKLSKHCTPEEMSGCISSRKGWSITGITWTNQSLRLAVWIHSNGVYMTTEMTRWTYSWINIPMVLGRIRSLLLVRPYQVNNQVKKTACSFIEQ